MKIYLNTGILGDLFMMQQHSEICLPLIPVISFQHFKGLPQNQTHQLQSTKSVKNMLFIKTGKGAAVTVIWTDFLGNLYSTKWKLPHMNVLTDCLSCNATEGGCEAKRTTNYFHMLGTKIHYHFYTAFSWFTPLISSLSTALI